MHASIAVSENEFDKSVAESVDESLSGLLGENVRQALYDYWRNGFSIPKDQIALKVNDLDLALEKTFGSAGPTVAKCIVKRLYSKLGLEFTEKSNYGLVEYVAEAKMKR